MNIHCVRSRLPYSPSTRAVAMACVQVALWLIDSPAEAQSRGQELRRAYQLQVDGHHEEALEILQQADPEQAESRVLVMIAQSEASLGRWDDAFDHLNQALGAENDSWIEARRSVLTRILMEEYSIHIALFWVRGAPNGAEIRVNGRIVGTAPMDHNIRVPANSMVRLEVRADGYRPDLQVLQLTGGEPHNISVNLEADRTNSLPVTIEVTPFDATVRVDGVERTRVRGVLYLDPGPHRLSVEAPGYLMQQRWFTAANGQQTRFQIRLLEASTQSTSETSVVPGTVTETTSASVSSGPPAIASDARSVASTVAWISTGTTLALGLTTGILAWGGAGTANDYSRQCRPAEYSPDCHERWQTAQTELNHRATLVNAFAGLAGVGAAVAIVSFVLIPSSPDARSSSTSASGLRLVLGTNHAGVRFSW